MSDQNIEHPTEVIQYNLPKLGILKWLLLSFLIFFIGFFWFFPLSKIIDGQIKTALASIPGCPIKALNVQTQLFMPKVAIDKMSVPPYCAKASKVLELSETKLAFRGISFSPLGIALNVTTTAMEMPLEFNIGASISTVLLNGENSINLAKVSEYYPKVKMGGDVRVNSMVELKDQVLKDFKLVAISQNFSLPSQKVEAFVLPNMNINQLAVKANMVNKVINVKEFILGDKSSPLRANFKGSITTSNRGSRNYLLNLPGELAFSDEIIKQYAIINMLMSKYDKKDNFYQLAIKGTLGAPKVAKK